MAIINSNNNGFLSGRLADKPMIWGADDKSKAVVTIKMTLAVEPDRPDSKGDYNPDFIEVTAFVRKDENYKGIEKTIYGKLSKGDKVNLNYALRKSSYTSKKDNQKHYELQAIVAPGSIKVQDSKELREDAKKWREANKAADATPKTLADVVNEVAEPAPVKEKPLPVEIPDAPASEGGLENGDLLNMLFS